MNSVLIQTEQVLKNILAWRDANKELVRLAPIPVIGGIPLNTGCITYASTPEADKFVDINFHRKSLTLVSLQFVAGDQTVKFLYDFSTWKISDLHYNAYNIDYAKEEALQDIITVYASTMAYMVHQPANIKQDGTEFEVLG